MNKVTAEIRKRLFELGEKEYGDFQAGLIPELDRKQMLGVRAPSLKSLAKELACKKDISLFLSELPHYYHEENMLHVYILSFAHDYSECITLIKDFLPFVENWAVCDSLRPKCFEAHRAELKEEIYDWLSSSDIYTVRFAVEMLMIHYLEEDFQTDFLCKVSEIVSGEYYLNMMLAWYFATALAKRWNETISFLEQRKLSEWVHKKTIQKAIESNRISEDRKIYLKQIRREGYEK